MEKIYPTAVYPVNYKNANILEKWRQNLKFPVNIQITSWSKEGFPTLSKVSEIDSKIIKDLLYDGRKSFVEIANESKMSKNKIWKRFKALEGRKIITGSTIQMNFAAFGYEALATLLINVEAQQIHQVMEYIEKIKEVRAYRQYYSVHNVRAVATLENLNELSQINEALKRKLPTLSLKTYVWTGVKNIPENLNIVCSQQNNRDKLDFKPMIYAPMNKPIDELDLKIVQILTLNGRTSFSEIGRQLEISTETVAKRYDRLKQSGALKVSIQINPNKLGYNAILDFNLAFATPTKLSGIVDSLERIPDVIIITKTSGDYDLQLTAMTRDIHQSFMIQEEIARISGITKMEVSARKIPNKWPTPRQYITTF